MIKAIVIVLSDVLSIAYQIKINRKVAYKKHLTVFYVMYNIFLAPNVGILLLKQRNLFGAQAGV